MNILFSYVGQSWQPGGRYIQSGGQFIQDGMRSNQAQSTPGGQFIPSGMRSNQAQSTAGGQFIPSGVRSNQAQSTPEGQFIPSGVRSNQAQSTPGGQFIPSGMRSNQAQIKPGGTLSQKDFQNHQGQSIAGMQFRRDSVQGKYERANMFNQTTRVAQAGRNRQVNQAETLYQDKYEHNSSPKTKTSIWYVNDIHCQIPKTERLVSAAHQAEISARQNGADFFKLCSGDTFIGSDEQRNKAAASFFNVAGIHAQAPGNHEFDITASKCAEILKNSNTKILGMNMNFPENDNGLSKKVMRSVIFYGRNGEKYGLIGVQPSDINERLKKKEILEGITIDDKKQTMQKLQEEVKLLENQGVNKIILLSHQGNNVEKEIAQTISGIDVILGGHSHDLIEGVKDGENLVYSPSGEPVVITQAGRDGNNFGVLNLEFDDKGRITYVQNNIMETNSYAPDMVMKKTINSILGESPVIGELKLVDKIPKNTLLEENPWADFVADALRTQLDSDIVLINSANFRGNVDTGVVTERDIMSIFPFANKLFKVKINEKDLVDAINACGKSLLSTNSKPGLMQVSGLTYKLDKEGWLTEMVYVDKNGKKRNIDVKNPNPNKVYTAIYDEFLIGGGDNLSMLKRNDSDIITRYPHDKDKVTIDYIKKLSQPFEVRKDNRIQII